MKQSELAKSLKLFIGLTCIILAICAFVIIPKVGKDMALESPEYSYLYYPFLVFIWITIIPFYAALFEGWKISNEINKDNSFSKKNMNSLNRIRRYALSECFLYFVGVSILKNGKAKAIRFTTLDKICEVLECQPGDILEYTKDDK